MFQSHIDNSILSKEYINHPVFEEIKYMMDFYESVSYTCYFFFPSGTSCIMNYVSDIYIALEGTLDSIQTLLKIGRINDVLVLVRKLFDDVLTEIYIDVIRKENPNWEKSLIVKDVDTWLKGKYRVPSIKKILAKLKNSETTQKLYPFFGWETYLKANRELLDDSVHSNRYQLFLLNCNSLHLENRIRFLQNVLIFLKQIMMIHLAFIFYLNPHYLMASDYVDYMDIGLTPPKGSESWIAPYAQKAFDKYIKPYPNLATFIKQECYLQIV
ncbi:hypothetical protein PI172_1216 [Prevotella intermedia]|uniref:Uncharacterized protein n=2 Tax=Prevotella intermedia TaxID=28131 RepID=A0AAD1F796_PREIN|nr:hypothetical protein PIN17_A1464 [Prevotella intermedia 17]APW34384.1 hypothetical protein BWX40_05780 [Prevotella intermedia]BAR95944.1 hypothetical protein PI172_1216 [Prevotella intermedia]